MNDVQRETVSTGAAPTSRKPYHVRLPGFLVEKEVGLGDVIKSVTYRAGINSCKGCDNRAAVLNSWIVFSR